MEALCLHGNQGSTVVAVVGKCPIDEGITGQDRTKTRTNENRATDMLHHVSSER